MAIKRDEVALGVKVVLNDEFQDKCIGDAYLKTEKVIYISDASIYNDSKGQYIHLRGGSHTNGGYAYLNEIDLEFDWRTPLPLNKAFK